MTMKFAACMNGWSDAPHQWQKYLLRPLRFERTPWFTYLQLFGFAFFFVPRR